MNGLSLLVYLTLFAQAPAPLGSALGQGSGTPAFGTGTGALGSGTNPLGAAPLGSAISEPAGDDSKTYGWEINKYNELEYIIQISPSLLSFMQNPADKQELASTIPPALVGRVKRVVVKIGTEVLPRTPIAEINKLIPAIASLPPDKIRDFENGSIVNVNNAGGNGIPGFPQSNTPGVNNSAPAPLGSAFADQARGIPTQGRAQGSLMDQIASSGAGISGQGRFSNTAQNQNAQNQNPNLQAAPYNRIADNRNSVGNSQGYVPDLTGGQRLDPYALGNGGYGASGLGTTGFGTNGTGTNGLGANSLGANGLGATGLGTNSYASNPAGNPYAQGAPYRNDAANFNSNLGNNAGFNGNAGLNGGSSRWGNSGGSYGAEPIYNQGINGQYPSRQQGYVGTGFGDTYGQTGNSPLDPRRLGASYANSGGLAPATGYLASNTTPRTDLPSTTQASDRFADSQRLATGRRTDLQTGSLPNYQAADNNYFFYMFFILSIAVNLWMVHLLRSLYLRYRNLLSSLRSQATSIG